ncbi:MAG: tetratricopeptide repeat protein [bacterium]
MYRYKYLLMLSALVVFYSFVFSAETTDEILSEDDYKYAISLIDERNFELAEVILKDLLLEYPENPYILHNLGLVRAGLSDLRGACGYWRRAILSDLNFEVSYLNLGIALIQMGEVKEAEGVLKTAIRMFTDNPHLHYNLAVSLGYQRRYEEAEAEYNKVLELKPDHLQSMFNLALLYQERNPTKAVELWKRYLKIARDIPEEARYVKEAEVYLQIALSNAIKE